MHMILRDGRFFALFRYKIPHVTYCKFITGISNKLASQRELIIDMCVCRSLVTMLDALNL